MSRSILVHEEKLRVELPTGLLTLVFTDIQDSSELSERYRADFELLRAAHFQILRDTLAQWQGQEVHTAGDALFVVFANVSHAIQWAVEAQRALSRHPWPVLACPEVANGLPIPVEARVRIGLHTGEPFLSPDAAHPDYFGPAVNRAALITVAAHGGQILLSHTTYSLVPIHLPAEITFRSCGLHRLKGVGQEPLWQVQAPGLLTDFPPLRTLDPECHNLPVPPTPYLGHEGDIHDWLAKLRDPATRLLTLTGFGGIGKTRSALHLAELAIDSFADGVWWVEAEEERTGEELLRRIVRALHLPPHPDIPFKEQILHFLKDRHLLLVLDNTEQVPDAGLVIKELLAQAPTVKFLVTSRRALDIQAERMMEVNPLPLSEAMLLFVNRARDRQPTFELSVENKADVEELCRRLEGIPLALELAASRIPTLAPRQMLQRLNERFKLLQTSAPDLPERQRALRATIDWSYDLLSEEAKRLFAQTAVFAGGFTLEDAEGVCEDCDVLAGVTELRRHSLLHSETDASSQQTRFTMLNSLSEYALERMKAAGEDNAACLRHARYFLDYARQRLALMRTPSEAAGLRDLKRNADNLRVAMETAQTSEDLELFAQLGLVCGRALWGRGFSEDAAQPLQAALDRMHAQEGASPPPALYAELLWERASVYLDQQNMPQAQALATTALDLCTRSGDRIGQARAANLLGSIARAAQQYAAARPYFAQALALLHSPQDDTDIANIYTTFGVMECRDPEGSLEDAEKYLQEAIRIRRRQEDRRGLAETLNNLGVLAYRQKNWPQAWNYYREALEHEQVLGNTLGIARSLFNLAEIAQVDRNTEQALRLAAASETLMERIKSPFIHLVSELLHTVAASTGESNRVEELRSAAASKSLHALIAWAMDE